MGKLGQRIRQSHTEPAPADRLSEKRWPPSSARGDELFAWMRENDPDSCPTAEELANATPIGRDWVEEDAFLSDTILYEGLAYDAPVDQVLEYFGNQWPDALFTEEGARVNGVLRERSEAQ
jgi:hypothetical protein